MIGIVRYGLGNVGAVQNMLAKVGIRVAAMSTPDELRGATKLILPGVGAFDTGISRLHASGLVPVLRELVVEQKKPLLGICLGMHLLTRGSTEGVMPGLGWVRAQTRRLDPGGVPGLRVPHMGWDFVTPAKRSALIEDMPEDARFYFLHSYYVTCDDPADSLLKTPYGITEIDSGFQHENIVGVQFHPEKSHRFGMWLLKRFAECA